MADVASTSAAHEGEASAVVTRTRLVVARHLAIVRIKFLPADIAAPPAGRAKTCHAIVVRRGREGTGSIGVSVGRACGRTMAAERVTTPRHNVRGRVQTWLGEPWPKMRRSRSVTLRAPAFFKMLAR